MFCNNLELKRLLQRGIDKWSYSQIGHQELSRLEFIQKVIKRELKQYIAAEGSVANSKNKSFCIKLSK